MSHTSKPINARDSSKGINSRLQPHSGMSMPVLASVHRAGQQGTFRQARAERWPGAHVPDQGQSPRVMTNLWRTHETHSGHGCRSRDGKRRVGANRDNGRLWHVLDHHDEYDDHNDGLP